MGISLKFLINGNQFILVVIIRLNMTGEEIESTIIFTAQNSFTVSPCQLIEMNVDNPRKIPNLSYRLSLRW